MRKIALVVAAALFIGLLGWRTTEAFRARQGQQQGPGRSRGALVDVSRAERRTLTLLSSYVGEVTPRIRVDVFPRISGVVSQLVAREGQTVSRGEILARLDPKELRFQTEQARASVQTQRVFVERARADLQAQRARLAQVMAGSARQEVRQAEEQVRQASANLDYSRAQLRRIEELFAQGFVPRQQVDQARLDVTLQEARLRAALQHLALLRAGPRPEEVDVARAQVAQAEVAVRQAQSQLAQTMVSLRQAQTVLAESVVRAPASGVVGRINVDAGSTVTPSTSLLELVDVDPAVIKIPVVEREMVWIRRGMSAVVRVDALPGRTFTGEVESISPMLTTATRTAEVEINIPNGDGVLRPGMFVRVEMVLARREGVVAVPVEAVVERNGGQTVFVVEEGNARERQVETGLVDAGYVEIVRGVQAGDVVVVSGQHNLRDGAPVIVPGRRGGPGGGAPGQGGTRAPVPQGRPGTPSPTRRP